MNQVFVEKNLRIEFPPNVNVRKFDDENTHGLSHCMKAVDFIVEEPKRTLYIEFKDPFHPKAEKKDREKWIREFQSGEIDEKLKYKFRDSFLYEWSSDRVKKPIHYYVLIALDNLDPVLLTSRRDDLKKKLPLFGLPPAWTRRFVDDCLIFNVETWNKHLPYRVSRIP
ncbi:MAG: hypothetical protein NUW37_13265 [Planctomycetes bacterium]|nr:hypothetical protein [Planctomycetota bacterium]